MLVLVTSLLALPAFRSNGRSATQNRRQLSETNILTYEPGSQVTDHANIDLDQQSLQDALSNFANAKKIYEAGGHSKPTATCKLDVNLGAALTKKQEMTITTINGDTITVKAYDNYAAGVRDIAFTYPVSPDRVEPLQTSCYVGGLAATDYKTLGCIRGSATPGADGTGGTANVITEDSSSWVGSSTITVTSSGATLTGKCANSGKRTLQGFSTKAQKVMYECNVTIPGITYDVGCPYTTYLPYYEYYGVHDYANQIVLAGLSGGATQGFTNGGVDFTGIDDTGRKEVIKKGTAYMNAWMYAIREFEDAIDDCAKGDIQDNEMSSDAVHAWDEGVAFYTGSIMELSALIAENLVNLPSTGVMAYTLGSKRCKNFGTCTEYGVTTVGEAAINIELFKLFNDGKYKLEARQCEALIPVKDRVASRMTVPLVQGTLRYAYKRSALGEFDDKTKAEGAVFAAGVLPQLHKCNPTAAQTVYDEMNLQSDQVVDFNAVKAAFEGCYSAMDITCQDVGGLLKDTANPSAGYYMSEGPGGVIQDATPCGTPRPTQEEEWQMKARDAGWAPCKKTKEEVTRRRRMLAEKVESMQSWNQHTDDE